MRTDSPCEFRPLTDADELIVWQMLHYAAHETTVEAVKAQPNLARYAIVWGREGDSDYAALVDGQPVGAAWLRLWTKTDRGFGYSSDEIPELAMAVSPTYRGRGIGGRLLSLTLQQAQSFSSAVSLSVRADNPVVRLYERAGFVKWKTVSGLTEWVAYHLICLNKCID